MSHYSNQDLDPSAVYVSLADGRLFFRAPVPGGAGPKYVAELRRLPGRHWHGDLDCNSVPESSRRALWAFLLRWHRGREVHTVKGIKVIE